MIYHIFYYGNWFLILWLYSFWNLCRSQSLYELTICFISHSRILPILRNKKKTHFKCNFKNQIISIMFSNFKEIYSLLSHTDQSEFQLDLVSLKEPLKTLISALHFSDAWCDFVRRGHIQNSSLLFMGHQADNGQPHRIISVNIMESTHKSHGCSNQNRNQPTQ